MISPQTLAAFLLASLPLALFPGQSVAFIVARSLSGGRRIGVLATIGVEIGYLVHVAAAVIGVSAIVAASATAFTVFKVFGALWLLWLAVQSWRQSRVGTLADTVDTGSDRRAGRGAFHAGFFVGALNPKTALFYLAFLPQFVSRHAGPVWLQLAILGICFILLASIPDLSWSILASSLRKTLGRVKLVWIDRAAAAVYGALAVVLLTLRHAT